jgi:hypothetical protein
MAVPIIIAVGMAAFGVKKGIDAMDDFDSAKNLNLQANEIYDSAKDELEKKREAAKIALEKLGKSKIEIYKSSMIPFVKEFEKIKNIEFKELSLGTEKISPPDKSEVKELCETSLELEDIVSGGVTALGAGCLAGFAAYGSVGVLASASTGTAIGTLSGAAATNATLAWLGGGSLASGGMGMAGGTAVLGGIVAGPVLAVGGMMLASKAEAAKNDAYSNKLKAELAVEHMKMAMTVTMAIENQLMDMNKLIIKLDNIFTPLLSSFTQLVERSVNYKEYSELDKKQVYVTVSTVQMLKMLLDTPILNSEGLPTQQSQQIIDLGPKLCNEVEQAALPIVMHS